jgi:hypothetical protein
MSMQQFDTLKWVRLSHGQWRSGYAGSSARPPASAHDLPRARRGAHHVATQQGTGGLFIGPIDGSESAACPAGLAPRLGMPETALVVAAGAGSANRLSATLDALLAVVAGSGEDVGGMFHIYAAVVGA